MKSKYKRLFANIGVFTLANFASRILHFLILPLYTYYLTTEEYGTIDLLSTTIALIFPIISLAICDAVIRYAVSDTDNRKKVFSIGFSVISVGNIIVFFLSIIVYIITKSCLIAVFLFVIYTLQAYNTLLGSYVKAIGKTKLMALITTSISFLMLGLNVVFVAFLEMGILGYWLSMVISNIFGIATYVLFSGIPHNAYVIKKNLLVRNEYFNSMIRYSLPLVPNALFWWINSSLDKWTLKLMTSLSVVGLYSVANKIPTIISTLNSIFAQAWNLSLFEDGTDDKDTFFKNTRQYYSEFLFCSVIILISVSPIIARFLFSKDFFKAWVYVPLLTMGAYFNAQNSFIGSLFTAKKQTKAIFTTTALGSIINIICNFVMIHFWGAIGAALATLLSYVVVYISRLISIHKRFSIDPQWGIQLFYFVFLFVECAIVMTGNAFFMVLIIVLSSLYALLVAYKTLTRLRHDKKDN